MRAQRSNESPSGAFKRQNALAPARWRGFAPTSSAASGAYASTPPLLRHKNTRKVKISRPTRPKSAVSTCYRCFLRARICPFRADAGREMNPDAPQEGAYNPAMRPMKSTQEGTFVWFRARGARKFKFSHFFGLLLRVRSGRPLHIYRPTRVQLNRSCAGSGEVQRRHAYDECPQKFR